MVIGKAKGDLLLQQAQLTMERPDIHDQLIACVRILGLDRAGLASIGYGLVAINMAIKKIP